jgi:hypothetical protein
VKTEARVHGIGKKYVGTSSQEAEQLRSEEIEYKHFYQFLEKHRSQLPSYYSLIGFNWLLGKQRFWRLRDRLIKPAKNLVAPKNGRKGKFLALKLAIIIIATLAFTLFKRILDCLSTSLNAFSTLGFGEIPVRGVAKYLAIVEGFIGWFLLSIFSVSLVSQILQ